MSIPRALYVTLLATLPAAVWAQTGVPRDWTFVLGGGVIVGPRFRYVGSDQTQALPLPFIEARWRDRVFVSVIVGAGVDLIATEQVRAGASVYPDLGRKESDGPLLHGMGDIASTAEARAFLCCSEAGSTGSKSYLPQSSQILNAARILKLLPAGLPPAQPTRGGAATINGG